MLTYALIAVTVVVSWLAFERPSLKHRLILWPPAIDRQKQFDRLISHGFIHADWMHLIFNMITLYAFGRVIESMMTQRGGPMLFVVFYLSAIVVAILPSYLRHRHDRNYASQGASGAVSAVLFASILLKPWSVIFIMPIPVPIPAIVFAVGYLGYSFWMDRRGGGNINHSAHLSGAIYGVLFMLTMDRSIGGSFLRSLMGPFA